MIINDQNFTGATIFPTKNDSPLIVNSNTVKTFLINFNASSRLPTPTSKTFYLLNCIGPRRVGDGEQVDVLFAKSPSLECGEKIGEQVMEGAGLPQAVGVAVV